MLIETTHCEADDKQIRDDHLGAHQKHCTHYPDAKTESSEFSVQTTQILQGWRQQPIHVKNPFPTTNSHCHQHQPLSSYDQYIQRKTPSKSDCLPNLRFVKMLMYASTNIPCVVTSSLLHPSDNVKQVFLSPQLT